MTNIDRIITENINRYTISTIRESSMSRIEQYIRDYEIAIITAWRTQLADETDDTADFNQISHSPQHRAEKIVSPNLKKTGDKFTTQEKKYYNKELQGALLGLGYGVTKIRGTYREGGERETQEESFFVVNLNKEDNFKDTMFKLSEHYNQDSFIYSPEGTDEAYLIGTNDCDFPGYGEEIPDGPLKTHVQSMYMSRIGNQGFSFTNGEKDGDMKDDIANNYQDDDPQTFGQRKDARIQHWNDTADERAEKKDVTRDARLARRAAKRAEKESVAEAFHLRTFDNMSINGKHAVGLISGKLIREIRNSRKSF